jgi:hexosaminidase
MKPSDLLLAPIPKRISLLGGSLTLPAQGFVVVNGDLPGKLLFAAGKLKSKLGDGWQVTASPVGKAGKKSILLSCDSTAARGPEGYALDVRKDGVTISSASPAGVFYGVCTLLQLMETGEGKVPCVSIVDWPDFPVRGVMLDISRDKVPTLETTKQMVDLMAEWKLNQLQLYTEHTFAYLGHEIVWKDASPFTGEEILELDAYCAERFVELAPNQNSFGHMGRWLKHKPYTSLGETPPGMTLTDGSKAKGSDCLSPMDPGSLLLLEDMFSQLLPHFSSRTFNVGCDETWSLGKGRSAELAEKVGGGRVYLDFLLEIHKLVRKHGRRMQFWGDIILKYPELIPDIPKDVVAMEWGYEELHDFRGKGSKFADSGLEFHVCPGTSSWNTFTGRTANAIGNLRNAGIEGLAAGATGYLNTDWGDGGHLQYLPVSYLGYLCGACASWNANAWEQLRVADALGRFAFRDSSGQMGQAVHDLGNAYLEISKKQANATLWGRIVINPATTAAIVEGVTADEFDRAVAATWDAVDRMKQAQMNTPEATLILDEFKNNAAMTEIGCRLGKLRLAGDSASKREKTAIAKLIRETVTEHERLWLARNRPGGLVDSKARLEQHLKGLEC